MLRTIDLNADVGEGFPHDAELLTIVTSANVACGFHAGDAATMRWVCERCAEHGVSVGAQVSYRDRPGFGRRPRDVSYDDLLADVQEQRLALADAAARAGLVVSYLKPHGALYHRVVHDPEQAQAVVDGSGGLAVLGLPGAQLLRLAEQAGLRTAVECFADRAYTADGGLVPRDQPDAVLSDVGRVADRVRQLVLRETLTANDGSALRIRPDSVCVHGDTPDAVPLARAVASTLDSLGVQLGRFG